MTLYLSRRSVIRALAAISATAAPTAALAVSGFQLPADGQTRTTATPAPLSAQERAAGHWLQFADAVQTMLEPDELVTVCGTINPVDGRVGFTCYINRRETEDRGGKVFAVDRPRRELTFDGQSVREWLA